MTSADPADDFRDMVARHHARRVRDDSNRPVLTFAEYRQVVRRFKPSELLPQLAALASNGSAGDRVTRDMLDYPPWAIALAARESVLWSNEHRREPVTGDSLRVLFNASSNIFEPRHGVDALDMLTRISYQQFPYQESILEEVSRPHALLIEGAAVDLDLEIWSDDAWTSMLGAPLGQVFGATFLLWAAAHFNRGWIDLSVLDRDDMARVTKLWPRDVIEQRLAQLSVTFDEFRTAYMAKPMPPTGFEEYAFNPLSSTPILKMPDGRLLAPQPRLILPTMSAGSLYYVGMAAFGEPFARDLGRLTEHYVGRQLGSITPKVGLFPEITYWQRKDKLKSIDWFLDLPTVLVLFEVKSARPGLLHRAAFGEHANKLVEVLGGAVTQLQRSNDAIDRGQPEFAHLPAGKQRLGVIVTAEPFYLANSGLVRPLLPKPPFPTLVMSLRELEHVVQLPREEIERQLVAIANDPERSTWSVANALDSSFVVEKNPILDRAWKAYPLPIERSSD